MKKILNFRPLFYCFIAFFLAILSAQYLFNTDWIYISIFIALIFGLLILSILRNKIKIYICILLFFSAGLLGYCIEASTYNVESYTGDSTVIGRVASVNKTDYKQNIVLDSISIDGEIINENVYIIIYGAPYLSSGDIVEFTSEIDKVTPFYDGRLSTFYYKNNIRYSSFVSGSSIEILGSKQTLSESVKNAVKEKLQQNMTEDNAVLAYATLFGDTVEINLTTLDDYRESGIAHILSISGLHVGIIVAFLYWILKKCHCKNLISFLIISTMLIFYCYLCGFSSSVLRSSIMSVCLLGSTLVGRKYDSLSAIGLAGLLILIVKPLSAYDIGFQLSFSCIIGIAMFYNVINSFFRKIKFPKLLSSSLAISISTQIFILPILINAFGGASFFSIFLNIIIIPIFSIAYIIVFLTTPLLFFSNFFANFLWLSSLLMNIITICARFVASISWAIIPKFDLSFGLMMAFYSIIFILSKYILFNFKTKLYTCLSIIATTAIFVGVSQIV